MFYICITMIVNIGLPFKLVDITMYKIHLSNDMHSPIMVTSRGKVSSSFPFVLVLY